MVHLRPVQENPHQGLREGQPQHRPHGRERNPGPEDGGGHERSAIQFLSNTFNDAESDALTYTATKADGNDLPTWLGFTASTRTFAGTPQAADVATVAVKVTASDGTASVSDEFDIVVGAGTTWQRAQPAPRRTPTNSGANSTECRGAQLGRCVQMVMR